MNEYNVIIVESSMELSAREKIRVKDTSIHTRIEDVLKEHGECKICPKGYVILSITNSKVSDDPYDNIVVIGEDDVLYRTGSNTFIQSFCGIFDEMKNEGERFEIGVITQPSKNYSGKSFMKAILL